LDLLGEVCKPVTFYLRQFATSYPAFLPPFFQVFSEIALEVAEPVAVSASAELFLEVVSVAADLEAVSVAAEPQAVLEVAEPVAVSASAELSLEMVLVSEPQASVDIAVAFVVLAPVSVVVVEVYSSGRPRFLAFPNVDHFASSSTSVEVVG
jgi:hypothetical protein